MHSKLAHKQYTNVHVSTVDRGRLLLMLYDGCIKFLKHAKEGLEKNDIPKFARLLSKAQAIISELMLTLDFEKGGDVAQDLDRLYDFMLFYLTEANLEKSPAKLQKVIDLIEVITRAYREVIEGQAVTAPEAAQEARAAKTDAEKKQEADKSGQTTPGGTLSVAF